MSKVQVTDLLNQRQIHRRYGRDLCKLGSRYTLPITRRFKHHCTLVRKIWPQRCQRICSAHGIRFPSVATVLASMAVVSRLVSPFQLRHTATRTYHITQNTSSTQSSGANRHTFLDTASCILLAQTIHSTLPIHLSHLPVILPHVQIPTHGRTRLERTGKHLLRSNSWQRNPSTLMLHRQHPLCPVKTRVGSDKPRKAKHYMSKAKSSTMKDTRARHFPHVTKPET